MGYYIFAENEKLMGAGQCQQLSDSVENIPVREKLYNSFISDPLRYIYSDGKIAFNPNYEEDKKAEERAELDLLTLTPADVERALYKAEGMDFEDLKALITEKIPEIDIKGLAIEFRAKDFYRGATLDNGTRLIDVIGALLGYSSADMDYLFENKELPEEPVQENNENESFDEITEEDLLPPIEDVPIEEEDIPGSSEDETLEDEEYNEDNTDGNLSDIRDLSEE